MALVLIGFMGAGKSTAAAELAAMRGREAIDSDALLQQRLGHPIAQEFEAGGEEAFRAAEERLVSELLHRADPRDVIALGGGAVLSPCVRDALGGSDHVVGLLHVDPDVAWERVRAEQGGGASSLSGTDAAERPLARDLNAFTALYAQRRELYEQAAHLAMLWARADSGSYPVFLARGLLGEGEEGNGGEGMNERLAALWPLDRSRSRPHRVSDTTVAALYGDRLGAAAASIAIPPGEPHKTLASAQRIWSELAAAGMTRADHLVALGGGVVGDLAGFCAATYQRGVPIVHLPTTLVAQIDSAYGGKTGVDLPAAKNYIGAYHQPAGVLVDPGTLATLPPSELAAGWVEVLKTALIAGGTLWERVAAMPGCMPDERTILDCIATKLTIVAADERDSGARQVLNLGHTIGHAIETATHYARYRHGEAVGLGLLAALRLSGAEQLRAQVRELLHSRDLPVTLKGADADTVLAMTYRDKKRTGEHVPFVLAEAPGKIKIGCDVASDTLRAAIGELI